ncbi:MAG: ABC transporter substrate-binding protein [Xenococcaceae cyanobacterium]
MTVVWLRYWLAVFRPLRISVALTLSCLLTLTGGCSPTQFKTKTAQVSQLVLVTPSNPTTFNYPLSQSPYSVFPFIYEGLVTENGITAELEPALAESWEISPSRRRITFTLRSGLKWSDQIGIKADLQVLSFNLVLKKLLRSRDWDCYVGAFDVTGADIEPNLLFLFWYSGGSFHQFNQGPQPGESSIEGWQVSDWEREIDSLFIAGVKELDEGKRREIYGRFQQIVAEQLPVFFLVNPLSFQAVRDHVENVKFSARVGAFWNIDELRITESFRHSQ